MAKRYFLIDGPNMTHAAQGAKKLTVGTTEVQAIYGFLRTLRKIQGIYPTATPVVLWDGASWRNQVLPDYKIIREKDHTKSYQRQQAEKASAKAAMPIIRKGLELLGVAQVKAMNMEADDLAAILGDRYAKTGASVMLISGDKDWLQLAGGKIAWFDPINDRKVRNVEDLEKVTGFKVSRFDQYVQIKALMGDAGDSVPGVGGIGPKGAQQFIDLFNDFANFSNMALDGTLDLSAVDPKFKKAFQALADDEDKRLNFTRNMRLVDLRHNLRPAPVNLNVNKGEPDIERFRAFCNRLAFASFTKELEEWVSVFPHFQPDLESAA